MSWNMSDKQVQDIVSRVLGEMSGKTAVRSTIQKSANAEYIGDMNEFYKNFVPNEVLGEGGCEPYDTDYGMMDTSSLTEQNPSPYPRTNRLLKRVHTTPAKVSDERAMLYTECHKMLGGNGGSTIVKKAKCTAYVMENVTLHIYPDELIIGGQACGANESPIYPEYSYDWVEREIPGRNWENRPNDVFLVSDSVAENLMSIADYWRGQNLKDELESYLSEDILNGSSIGSTDGIGIVHYPNLYTYAGLGHTNVDFEGVIKVGLKGIKAHIVECMTTCDDEFGSQEYFDKMEFWTAALIAMDGTSKWIRRYAKLAKEMAAKEADLTRKQELLQISENCDWISENPPQTVWQAMQMMMFMIHSALCECNGHSMSWGRFDMICNPFYEADMKAGRVTKSFVSQLMESFYIKIYELRKCRDDQTASLNSEVGLGGELLLCGGVDSKGQDATNDCSYLAIEAYNHTRLPEPWFAARWFEDSTWEWKVKCIESIKIGTGQPKLFNDLGIIPTLIANGFDVSDARNYAVVGCVEIEVGGMTWGEHDANYFNLMRVLEFAMNNGKAIEGKQMSIDTGNLADFKSIDELAESYKKQMKYWVDHMVAYNNALDIMHNRVVPIPLVSCYINDCIEKGKDLTAGGARFNFTGPQGVGIGSTADAFAAIEQVVFDEKRVTGAQLLDALRKDWEGYEDLWRYINSPKVHHYGNDDDYADKWAVFVADQYSDNVNSHTTPRGGRFTAGIYSVSGNVTMGMMMGATADGRKAGEALSNSLGPQATCLGCHDTVGPTAVGNSANKIDHQKCGNGTLMNVRFSPSSVAGPNGTANMIHYTDAYFHKGAQHIQYNIANNAMLRDAQAHPENYPGLLVRVAGYSAYFVRMTKNLQDDLIERNSYDNFN